MLFHSFPYTHIQTEFDELCELMERHYLVSRKPFNWRFALAENWNYASRYLEPLEYFTSRVRLWRDDSQKLIGALIRGRTLIHLQVDPDQRGVEAEMIAWAEDHWAVEVNPISTMVYDWDVNRQRLLADRGYENTGAIEDVRIYDLSQPIPDPRLPDGHWITSLAEYGSPEERIELENALWGVSLDMNWFRGKASSPHYSPNWDLIAVAPDGKLSAFNLVWLYPRTQSAEIDPLGVHPDHRRKGLSRAIVLESFKRMRDHGIRWAYIASESDDPIVCNLYSSLNPAETYQGFRWVKKR